MNSQNAWVLRQLEAGKHLSSRNAVIEYGIQDLPKRISDLRKMNYEIEDYWESGVNRHGRKTRWKVYWMANK